MVDPTSAPPPWLDDWVHGQPLGPPTTWGRPGLALLFNLECAGCVSRAIPWFKRASLRARDRATTFGVHSAYGHRTLARSEVVPNLQRFAEGFARLAFPVALDVDGAWAASMGAAGTPHWIVWDAAGRVERSLYGSQANALTRLEYVLEAWGVEHDGADDGDEGEGRVD